MADLNQLPKSGVFQVRFRFGGKRPFRSLHTTDEEEAKAQKLLIERTISDLQLGRAVVPAGVDPIDFIVSGGVLTQCPGVPGQAKSLGEVREAYRESKEGVGEKASLNTEMTHCKRLEEYLGEGTLFSTINTEKLGKYVKWRRTKNGLHGKKVQDVTIRKELATFYRLVKFAKARDWEVGRIDKSEVKTDNPDELPRFQTRSEIEDQINRGGLTDEEQRQLWQCLYLRPAEVLDLLKHVKEHADEPHALPIFAIAALAGVRRSEIIRMEYADVDFRKGLLNIRQKKAYRNKGNSFRYVDIHPKLAKILKDWVRKHPGGRYLFPVTRPAGDDRPRHLTQDEATKLFDTVVKGSKWEVLKGYHCLRHSFASICAMKGLRDSTIDAWMGHQTEEMRKRYRHLFPEANKAEMAKLF